MTYNLEQLADLENIRACALRYCRGVDRLDAELMKSAYWQEANDYHGTYNGPAYPFVDHCMISHQRWRFTHHCVMNHAIEFDNDQEARGEIYNVTYLLQKDQDILDTWHGRYLDRYEKRRDEWRIIDRVCVHETTHSREVTAMEIAAGDFRQGSFDRGVNRPLGA